MPMIKKKLIILNDFYMLCRDPIWPALMASFEQKQGCLYLLVPQLCRESQKARLHHLALRSLHETKKVHVIQLQIIIIFVEHISLCIIFFYSFLLSWETLTCREIRVQINISYMQSVAGKWVQEQVYPYGSYYVSEHQQPPPVIVNIALVKESFYWYMSLQTIFKEHMYHTIMYIFCEVFKKLFEISAWNLANNVSMPGSRFCIKLGHR